MTSETLLKIANGECEVSDEELREWFRKEVINSKPDPEFHKCCVERQRKIDNDFELEWSQKKFKWFFKKRRQNKLMTQISLRYPAPIFYFIDKIIEEISPDITMDNGFGQFVEFRNITLDDKNDRKENQYEICMF